MADRTYGDWQDDNRGRRDWGRSDYEDERRYGAGGRAEDLRASLNRGEYGQDYQRSDYGESNRGYGASGSSTWRGEDYGRGYGSVSSGRDYGYGSDDYRSRNYDTRNYDYERDTGWRGGSNPELTRDWDRGDRNFRGFASRDYGRREDYGRDYGTSRFDPNRGYGGPGRQDTDRLAYGADYSRDVSSRDFRGFNYGRSPYEREGYYASERDLGRSGEWGPSFGTNRDFGRSETGRGWEMRRGYGEETFEARPDVRVRREGEHGGFMDRLREGARRLTGKGPKTYQRSDERIREDVCDRLMRGWVNAEDVDVDVKNGNVTLKGSVSSRDEKRALEDIAEDVLGVKDVDNHVKVRRGDDDRTLRGRDDLGVGAGAGSLEANRNAERALGAPGSANPTATGTASTASGTTAATGATMVDTDNLRRTAGTSAKSTTTVGGTPNLDKNNPDKLHS